MSPGVIEVFVFSFIISVICFIKSGDPPVIP